MAVTNVFKEAVESNSVRKVRIMMKDSLLVDPTFAKFEEMERIASAMDGLYDEHDGNSFQKDRSTWDDEYMNNLMVDVLWNFSHERVEHLKEVVRYLRPVKEKPASVSSVNHRGNSGRTERDVPPRGNSAYQEQKMRDMREGSYRGTKAAAGAAAGAVIGGAVAFAVEAPVVAGALAGAAVAGTVTYIVTQRKE